MPAGSTRKLPYAQSRMAQFLTKKISSLKSELSQREIAQRLGYRPNFISMLKTGEAKVPFEKIPALAEALGVDVAHLMRLGLEQYWSEKMNVITEVFSRMVTANEMELVRIARAATGHTDPKLTAEQGARIHAILSTRPTA